MSTDYLLPWPVGGRDEYVPSPSELDAEGAPYLARDLCQDFAAKMPEFELLEEYYCGNPPLAREPERLSQEYRELLIMGRSNWVSLVVDVVNERLRVGSTISTANPVQDPVMWNWWQRNNMDGVAPQIHAAALKFG